MAISKLATKNGDYRIELLGVAIGFGPMDVARQLANDEAGLRFLVVAAALLSLGSPFNAAESLHLLLSRTFPTANKLPTLHELRDLFIALQRRFDCSDFGTYVLGWKTLLDRAMPPTQVTELQPNQPVGESSTGLGPTAQALTSQRRATEFGDGSHHGLGRGPVTLQQVSREANGGSATGSNTIDRTPTVSSSLVLSRGPIPAEVSAANEHIASVRDAMEALQTSSPEDSEAFLQRTGVARFGIQSISTGSWNVSFSRDQEGTFSPRYKHLDEQDVEDPDSQQFSDASGRYSPLQCPSSSQIHALLGAMNELHGAGGAILASIRTPRVTAAWIIAFIRWCFGAEPTVYCLQREAAITVQKQSNIIVEVDENSKCTILVQTFTSINSVHHLFNSTVASTVEDHSWPFKAMVKIKSHFLSRLSALRPYYEIPRAIDYLLHLASAIGILGDSGYRLRSLPKSELLLGLVGDYFDVDDCKQRLRSADLEPLKLLDTTRLSELFEEILYSSQIRTLFEHGTSELYVVAGQHHLTGHLDSELSIAKVIDQNFHHGTPIEYEEVLSPPNLTKES